VAHAAGGVLAFLDFLSFSEECRHAHKHVIPADAAGPILLSRTRFFNPQ
jgi:hypothetical protein